MTPRSPLDTAGLLRALTAQGVDFVVIGGIAAVLHGSPRLTQDLDICFATDPGNLDALGAVLTHLKAHLAGVADEVPFVPDAQTLKRIIVFTLETDFGPLDVLASPAGAPAYPRLRENAARFDIGGAHVLVASIDDLIAMKRAAGRPKDLVDVVELEIIRDRTESR